MISINPASKIHQTDTVNQKSKKRQTFVISSPSKNHKKTTIGRASKKHQALNFEKTRRELEALSNRELLANLEKLTHKERRLKVLVLLYLSEIDSRELYLPMGFSSLFDFCTGHLGYTRATAARRIRAARTCTKYPEALDMLRSGEINITTLSMISDILDQDNYMNILDSIKNKSTRQVEMLVSEHRPVPVIRDTVRPVCIKRRVQESEAARGAGSCGETEPADLRASSIPVTGAGAETGGLNLSTTEDTGNRKCNKLSSSAGTKISPKGRMILEQRLKLGFSVSPEFMKKYNKIKSLLSSTYPEGIDFETLFEHLMSEYLEKHDPEQKRERRLKKSKVSKHGSKKSSAEKNKKPRERGDAGGGGGGRNGFAGVGGAGRKGSAGRNVGKRIINNHDRRSRHIPPAVRERVYARDKGRCTFIGANGRRCNSTWDLELDHIVPFAKGGDNSPGNLRLLCRKHNIHHSEKTYGRKFAKNIRMEEHSPPDPEARIR